MKLIPAIRETLKAHKGDWSAQGFWVLSVHRFGEWRYGIRFSPARKLCSFVYKISYKVVQILTGVEFPCEAAAGQGTRIDHFGGIIISGYASFGDYCVIRQGVTVGLKNEENPVGPRIGNYVNIGAGAKIIGDITIGDHVDIGANSVILTDIPANSIAVGIPARIIPKRVSEENSNETVAAASVC